MKTKTKLLKKKSDKKNDHNNINNDNINKINENSNINNINDLKNYEQFFKLFETKGFKNISIVEFESENYIGFELKPNEIYQIEQILNSGGRSINIFIGGQRYFINSSTEHFVKASNEDGGVVIHKTKSKYFIATYDLKQLSNLDVAFTFTEVLENIYNYNTDDFITNLV